MLAAVEVFEVSKRQCKNKPVWYSCKSTVDSMLDDRRRRMEEGGRGG